MQEPTYRPQLDGVRAFCILFTICNHSPGMPGWINGGIGVDVFFALSGWLITWLLMKERQKNNTIDLAAFYIRRAFRIIPLYLVTIILYVAAALLMLMFHQPQEWNHLKMALPYLGTFNGEYRPDASGNIFGHAWTLGIEEKFYILWPFALLLGGRRLWPAFTFASLSSLVLIWIGDGSGFLLRGYAGLGFGAILAVAVYRWAQLSTLLQRPVSSYISLACMALAYVGSIAVPHPYGWNVGISFFSAFFIASLWFNGLSVLARMLSWGPIEFVGKLTYGMYLLHVLVLNFSALIIERFWSGTQYFSIFMAGYLVSLLVAYILHLAVERPLIKMGRKFASRRKSSAAHTHTPALG